MITQPKQFTPIQFIAEYIQQSNILDIPNYKGANYRKFKEQCSVLIAECICNQNRHSQYSGAYDLGGYNNLKNLYGKTTKDNITYKCAFNHYNEKLGLFTVVLSAAQGSHNTAFKLSGWVEQKLNDHFGKVKDLKLTDYSDWQKYQCNDAELVTYIEPCISAIEAAYNNKSINIKYKLFMWSLVECSKHYKGKVYQYYRKSKKGRSERLFTVGSFGLQFLKSDIIDIILKDYNEFDMNAAAYSILFSKSQNKSSYPNIQKYVDDVKSYRTGVAQRTNTTVKQVKLAFLHKSFDSSLNSYTEAYRAIGKDEVNRIKSDHDFKRFSAEFKKLKEELTNPKVANKEKLKFFKSSVDNGRQWKKYYLAWLYQSIEIQILLLMKSACKKPNDCLLMHDGLYTKHALNTVAVQDTAKILLDIDITIS